MSMAKLCVIIYTELKIDLLIIVQLKLSFTWLKLTQEFEFCSNTLNSFSFILLINHKSPASFQWNLIHWSSYFPTFIKAINHFYWITDPEILAHKGACILLSEFKSSPKEPKLFQVLQNKP